MRIAFALAAALTSAFAPDTRASTPTRRPNVVVILTDDQGWGDLSLNGNLTVKTPNIDAIGRRGAVFDRFYVCPLCSPTRAELLTGRYHQRAGVRGVSTGLERMNLNERTIAQLFRAAGYRTGVFGKWHNGSQWPYHPNARGFDEFYGFASGHWGEYFDPPLERNGVSVRGKGYIADDLTDKALEFIEKNRDGPFFCYVPYNTPHAPFSVPDEFWKRFKDIKIEQAGGKGAMHASTRCALAMVENLDRNVGRILRKLVELDIAEDTIVVFLSDNGPNGARWNGGMRGIKGSTDEGGVRVPFLIRYPSRIPPGTVVTRIASGVDLLPTLANLAGVAADRELKLDGRDLSPLLAGAKVDWPERTIVSCLGAKASARTQTHRLDAEGRLYDMIADPGQTNDIAAKEPKLADKLKKAVADWRKDVLVGTNGSRPFPVGYVEFPTAVLPARDGVPGGGVRRSAAAPNCSYFTNWTSKDDTMTWDIDVHTAGLYRPVILQTCAEADVGTVVELSFQGVKTTGKASQAWDPPLLDKQDRVPRSQESYMKEFRELPLDAVRLPAGRGALTLRAIAIPGRKVLDVRSVVLTLVDPTK